MPDQGPCYRCLFPEPPPPGAVPSCAEAGVLGVLPGIVGCMQALETLVSISAGSLGAISLMNEHALVRRWTFRVAAVGGSAVLAMLGYLLFNLG